jgi:mannosyltransferase OCH1-like enzyme
VSHVESTVFSKIPPKRIVQFWNDLTLLPGDVRECIETWKKLVEHGFEVLLFDEHQARDFIRMKLGPRYENAYRKCYHPAMQSDYFRLCYIFIEGGGYVDADDVFRGHPIQHLFRDGRLKIQPLCYDMSTNKMVSPKIFTRSDANELSWIFYFNNNPLIAASGHPVVEWALREATQALECEMTDGLPEIQSTTGPGNLTKSIFDAATEKGGIEETIDILSEWENIATSRWPLSYRNDERNWRLSNRREYRAVPGQANYGRN